MDVLLDFPPDVLERTTPTLTAFCLPITPLVQLAGEVVWISHRRGLGMPRHRKTRLLHWPAYRLLFLIRVLDWKRIVSNREQGVVPFHLQDFFSHVATAAQTADLWVLKVWIEVNGKPHTFFYHRPSYNQTLFPFEVLTCTFSTQRKVIIPDFFFLSGFSFFLSLSLTSFLAVAFVPCCKSISHQNRPTSANSRTSLNSHL